jgi:flagellar biosynthesis protein FlhG
VENVIPINGADNNTPLRVIAVASGKGGVGKTVVSANLAVTFGAMGKRVLVLDADLGLANIDIMLGLTPTYHIGHLLSGTRTFDEVVVPAAHNVWVLPAASGIAELAEMSNEHKLAFLSVMDAIEQRFDFIIIDNAAGIGQNVVYFSSAGQEILIVLTPEPTAITDAYAAIKVLYSRAGVNDFDLIINQARSKEDAADVFARLSAVTSRFLNVNLRFLGHVTRDESTQRAVLAQEPLATLFPHTPVSRCIKRIAETLVRRGVSNSSGRVTFGLPQALGERQW